MIFKKLVAIFFIALVMPPTFAEELPAPYKDKRQGSAEMGFIRATTIPNTQHAYIRTYGVNERKYWRWYGNVSGSRTTVNEELVSERFEGLLQGDYKWREREYMFFSLGYENDVFQGYNHRVTEIVGYGHKYDDSGPWENRAEAGLGMRHTKFKHSNKVTNKPIVNVKGIIKYHFTEKTSLEENMSIKLGEDTTIWTSDTSLEQSIVKDFALKIALTGVYTDNPPPGVKTSYSISRVTFIYNFSL